MEPSDDCPYCFLGSMGREADLGDVGGGILNVGVFKRLGRAKFEGGLSTNTGRFGSETGAVESMVDRLSNGVMHFWTFGRCATGRE